MARRAVFSVMRSALMAVLLLAACMRGAEGPATQAVNRDAALAPQAGGSAVIADLQARRSLLPPGGAYAQVADAVLAAGAGADQAALRVARLKAEARSKNWLPQIGPQVSLTSLSGLAASLLVEQALFDNGRRKAERAFAAADVDVAAVVLASDANQRVFDGLMLYLNAERARAQAAVAVAASARLAEFERVVALRVDGGLSDRAEEQVIRQRSTEMQATVAADQATERAALTELAAMAARPLDGLRGADPVPQGPAAAPLAILRAQSEAARALAGAQIERAGLMPGLSASAALGDEGVKPGLRLGGALVPGTRSAIAALDQTADLVARQTAEATEAANRRHVALTGQLSSLQTHQQQGAEVLRQTKANLELFTEQYKSGRRTLLELVGQYDATARLERDQVSLRYEIALVQLELARDQGLLVDGARM